MKRALTLSLLVCVWAFTASTALAVSPPVAQCQNVTVEADANCSASASVDNGSYDPEGGALTITQEPAGPYALGQTSVKLVVVAASGLADTCEAVVTVNDTTPPTVTCPADILVGNDPGECGASVSYQISATDNCSISSPLGKQAASFYPVGTTIITPVVTDGSGNEGTCSFKVTVKDTELPKVICPANIEQGNDPGMCGAVVNFNAEATDNCPGVKVTTNPVSGSTFPLGATTVWAFATDASGNKDSCSFTVTINDTQKPAVACPAPIIVGNDPGQCAAIVNYDVTATDNCDPNPIVVLSVPSGSLWPVGTHDVTAIATDAAGNADTCHFTVQVNDTEKPHVTCPPDMPTHNDPGQCGAFVTFDVTGLDNCAFDNQNIVVTPPSGSFFPIGPTQVTAIGTDLAGNADTCSFMVTVSDTTKPHIDHITDIVKNNDPGQCGAVVSFDHNAIDNCPVGLVVVATPQSGSFFAVGPSQVIITATDASGNADTIYFNVTVNDVEKPVVTCPANIVVEVGANDTGSVVNFDVPATDNCPGLQVITTPLSGSFFRLGVTPVKTYAIDAHALVDSCEFLVEVKKALNPGLRD